MLGDLARPKRLHCCHRYPALPPECCSRVQSQAQPLLKERPLASLWLVLALARVRKLADSPVPA